MTILSCWIGLWRSFLRHYKSLTTFGSRSAKDSGYSTFLRQMIAWATIGKFFSITAYPLRMYKLSTNFLRSLMDFSYEITHERWKKTVCMSMLMSWPYNDGFDCILVCADCHIRSETLLEDNCVIFLRVQLWIYPLCCHLWDSWMIARQLVLVRSSLNKYNTFCRLTRLWCLRANTANEILESCSLPAYLLFLSRT